jgi:hypothetical protein
MMKTTIILILLLVASTLSAATPKHEKARIEYETSNGVSLAGLEVDYVNGEPVISKWPLQTPVPTLTQINALVAAYDARMAAEATAKADRVTAVSRAFLDLKAQLQSELNITVNSPAELRGKMPDVSAAAEAKIQAATSVPQIKGVMKLLFTYIVLVDRREDIKE